MKIMEKVSKLRCHKKFPYVLKNYDMSEKFLHVRETILPTIVGKHIN
jgi:hypothetical protein